MFSLNKTKSEIAREISDMDEVEFARFMYCQKMVSTYIGIAVFESNVISAMVICDKIRVKSILGNDAKIWDNITKQKVFQSSTLGTLIKILQKNGISKKNIDYLNWVKHKRDYFVHRLFQEGAWPAKLSADDCKLITRRLVAIQWWLYRATARIWFIFEEEGLVLIDNLGDAGLIIMPSDYYDEYKAANASPATD